MFLRCRSKCGRGVYGTYLGQGAIVPNVAVVGEHVGHKAQLALLGVLFDRVQTFRGTDLRTGRKTQQSAEQGCSIQTDGVSCAVPA